MAEVAIVAGYVVRCPLAGYAWQALHYLVGLRALGFDPYFYEDTAWYPDCFDPGSGEMGDVQLGALTFAAEFFGAHGFGDRWIFWDARADRYAGRERDEARGLLRCGASRRGLESLNWCGQEWRDSVLDCSPDASGPLLHSPNAAKAPEDWRTPKPDGFPDGPGERTTQKAARASSATLSPD